MWCVCVMSSNQQPDYKDTMRRTFPANICYLCYSISLCFLRFMLHKFSTKHIFYCVCVCVKSSLQLDIVFIQHFFEVYDEVPQDRHAHKYYHTSIHKHIHTHTYKLCSGVSCCQAVLNATAARRHHSTTARHNVLAGSLPAWPTDWLPLVQHVGCVHTYAPAPLPTCSQSVKNETTEFLMRKQRTKGVAIID